LCVLGYIGHNKVKLPTVVPFKNTPIFIYAFNQTLLFRLNAAFLASGENKYLFRSLRFDPTAAFIYAFNMRTIYPVIYSKYLFIYFSEPHWWRKIVSVLSSSAVDRGFEPRSGQTEDYEIGIFSLRSLHVFLYICTCNMTSCYTFSCV
jgi:hypothetical protein